MTGGCDLGDLTGRRILAVGRHARSAAQSARRIADESGIQVTLGVPDHQVPLSRNGWPSCKRLGHWLRRQPKVSGVRCSHFFRAVETVLRALEAGQIDLAVEIDPRLGEMRWGKFDGLTKAERRRYYGELVDRIKADKFNNAPPDGECWSMVVERVRPVLDEETELALASDESFRLIECHEVTLKCIRYVLEGMTVPQVLALPETPNASITLYELIDGKWVLLVEDFLPGEEQDPTPEPDPKEIAAKVHEILAAWQEGDHN